MNLHFSKYHGTGNDFILIDNRTNIFPKESAIIQHLCNSKFGIGSDGLILIEEHPTLDYRMIFFNPDGSESFCGNGSRCGFVFAQTLNIATEKGTFEAVDGFHKAEQLGENVQISVLDVDAIQNRGKDYFLIVGSPHHVKIVEDLDKIDVVSMGRAIRYSKPYADKKGTNVNFAQLFPDQVLVRTYERGVENETLSCGTGVTAVALVAGQLGYNAPIQIKSAGGKLRVEFTQNEWGFQNIWLIGPVEFVFSGTVKV